MLKTVALVGTMDTKGEELLYLRSIIEQNGLKTIIIDVGATVSKSKSDYNKDDILSGLEVGKDLSTSGRAQAIKVLYDALPEFSSKLYHDGKFDGVISIGGSGGSVLAYAFMQSLPIGVPKLIVSTMASGDTRPYVGESDITMMYSVVDIEGINSISKAIFNNAANAISGMVKNYKKSNSDLKKIVAVSMFGVTTPCVKVARRVLEDAGYEVIVFHATGAGGKSMENLISSGFIDGVLDLTTTEICDEIVGGVLSAGASRLTAASSAGIPQVVSVGAMDMVNFGAYDTVPAKFQNRLFYKHNPSVTLMRTTAEENIIFGKNIASKLNDTKGKTAMLLPLKGVSAIDTKGQPFYDESADKALFESVKSNLNGMKVELIELENNINDDEFAVFAANKLIEYMLS